MLPLGWWNQLNRGQIVKIGERHIGWKHLLRKIIYFSRKNRKCKIVYMEIDFLGVKQPLQFLRFQLLRDT